MAHGGFGVGVLVVGIDVPGALLHEVAESTLAESISITARQIATELVYGDLQDKSRSGICALYRLGHEKK
jgi:hypothetical protein